MTKEFKLDKKQSEAIRRILAKGERVEIVPVKDGYKLLHIKKEELKTE